MSEPNLTEDLRRTRETMIEEFASIKGKLDSFGDYFEKNEFRLQRVEDFCEEKRRAIAEIRPVVAAVFGTGLHDPGLVARVRTIEEDIGLNTGDETVHQRLDRIEKNVITKQDVTSVVAITGGVLAIITGTITGIYYWFTHWKP